MLFMRVNVCVGESLALILALWLDNPPGESICNLVGEFKGVIELKSERISDGVVVMGLLENISRKKWLMAEHLEFPRIFQWL